MRIGIVSPEFPPDIGGIETYSCQFAKEVARRGHDVTVFTIRHRQGETAIPGVTIVPGLSLSRKPDRLLLSGFAFDVWHVMNAAYSWLSLEFHNVVVSVHGNDFLRPYYPLARPGITTMPGMWRLARFLAPLEVLVGRALMPRLLRRSLPKARHILANSRYTEKVFLDLYPECRGRTSAAMVGVGDEFLEMERSRKGSTKGKKLLTLCRLSEPRKNVDLVLRALGRLKERFPFSYSVIGDGDLKVDLEKLAEDLGLGDRVAFTGFLPEEEVKTRLVSSDLFVLPSSIQPGSHEGFGIVYLEANACGSPVLAARLAGAAEAVEEGVSGFFVEEPSVESLARALESFLSGERVFDSEACRQHARRFSWSRVADCALEAYGPGDSR